MIKTGTSADPRIIRPPHPNYCSSFKGERERGIEIERDRDKDSEVERERPIFSLYEVEGCRNRCRSEHRRLQAESSDTDLFHMASRALWASKTASFLRISPFRRGFASVLEHLKYADSHEWADVDGSTAKVGITDHAQDHLGDVVYVELPEVGATVSKGKNFGAVESVKATSDVNSPVSGKVIEVNAELNSSPGLINGSPYKNGWIIKVEMSDSTELSSLMDSSHYTKFCEEEDAKH